MSAICNPIPIEVQWQWGAWNNSENTQEKRVRTTVTQYLQRSFAALVSSVLSVDTNIPQSASVTSSVESTLNWFVEHNIAISNAKEIRDYLLRYSDLVALIPAICETTAERFEAGTQLSIDHYRDPQYDNEYLTLYINTPSAFDVSMAGIIDSITDDFSQAIAVKKGWILLIPDFRLTTSYAI